MITLLSRNDTKIRKQVEVDKDDFEWYISTHSNTSTYNTGFSNLMAMLLKSYREVCQENNSSLKDLTTLASRELKNGTL